MFGDLVENSPKRNTLFLPETLPNSDGLGVMSAVGTMVIHILAPVITIKGAKYINC